MFDLGPVANKKSKKSKNPKNKHSRPQRTQHAHRNSFSHKSLSFICAWLVQPSSLNTLPSLALLWHSSSKTMLPLPSILDSLSQNSFFQPLHKLWRKRWCSFAFLIWLLLRHRRRRPLQQTPHKGGRGNSFHSHWPRVMAARDGHTAIEAAQPLSTPCPFFTLYAVGIYPKDFFLNAEHRHICSVCASWARCLASPSSLPSWNKCWEYKVQILVTPLCPLTGSMPFLISTSLLILP